MVFSGISPRELNNRTREGNMAAKKARDQAGMRDYGAALREAAESMLSDSLKIGPIH